MGGTWYHHGERWFDFGRDKLVPWHRSTLLFLFGAALLGNLLLAGVSWAAGDDCAKAKEYYASGAKLLNFEERRAMFQKAVDLCPSYAEAHVNLADALENLGILGQGITFDEKSLTWGNALLDEAVKHYTKAVELNRNLYQAHIGLGDIFLGQGRYEPAAQEFRKALDRDPGNDRARTGLEQAGLCLAGEARRGLRTSDEIKKRAKECRMEVAGRVMGVENHMVKDRESFDNILFAGWSARIASGEPTEQLNEIGRALSSPELEGFRFVVEGHTNSVGGFDENMKLSWDRARSVKNHLVNAFKMDPDRLVTQGFGYSRPKVTPENEPGNRRVEILFLQKNAGN